MAKTSTAAMGIGDWWNRVQREGHQEDARRHKAQAQHHENALRALEKSALDLGGWNPLTAMAKSHHRKLAEHHRIKQDYHESHASDRMTDQEKRDSHGRWTASMAERAASMGYRTRDGRYVYGPKPGQKKKQPAQRLTHGELERMRPAELKAMAEQTAEALRAEPGNSGLQNDMMLLNGVLAGRGLQPIKVYAAFSTNGRGAAMSRRQHYEARRARQMAMGLSFGPTGGVMMSNAASFSCPPKFHKLYTEAGFKMGNDGQVMRDGKPCSSRRAKYFAASAAKYHKLYTEASGDASMGIGDFIKTTYKRTGDLIKHPVDTVKNIIKNPRAEAQKTIDDYKSRSSGGSGKGQKHDPSTGKFAGFSLGEDGQPMRDGKPCSSRRAAYFARRGKAAASPNGQVPSSDPRHGDEDVTPLTS